MTMRAASVPIILVLALSGCAGAEPQATSTDCPSGSCQGPGTVSPPEADADTGAIDGLVVDDQINPIPGAQVGLKETGASAATDAGGRFAFSKLPPGQYTILVNALGYESVGKGVAVVAGEVLQAQFVLAALASEEPFPEVRVFEGLIECGFGTSAVVGNCIPLQFLFQMLNINPTNTRTVGLYEVSDPPKVKGGVFEMVWTPSTAGSGQALGLYVDSEGTGPTAGTNYAQEDGPSPVRVEVDEEPYKALTETKKKLQTRTFLPGTTPPSYVVNQRFTVYGTACYHAVCPPEYTAIADA